MTDTIVLILTVINSALLIFLLIKALLKKDRDISEDLRNTRIELNSTLSQNIQALGESLKSSAESQNAVVKGQLEALKEAEAQLNSSLLEALKTNDLHTKAMLETYAERLSKIESTLETRVKAMEESNGKKLDEMRQVVDEKLQKTLEDRISRSFKEVSEKLAQVYQGLGEMQTLATGVGDLKKVLSNVKARGILGEIQLGAILEEMLSPEQYDKDIATVEGSANRVEFAVKLPGNSAGSHVYLPIDAKFPLDAYNTLIDAYDNGNPDEIKAAKATLETRIKSFASDISKKYISPPQTTDFGILFLPIEGLYSEAVRLGLVEKLQKDYKISLAGPTTMAALLNSLQMGFRTLAIQKRSGEIWDTLSAVKTEFAKFEDVLNKTQEKLRQASSGLEELVGARTKKINIRLKSLSEMPEESVSKFLPLSDTDVGEQ